MSDDTRIRALLRAEEAPKKHKDQSLPKFVGTMKLRFSYFLCVAIGMLFILDAVSSSFANGKYLMPGMAFLILGAMFRCTAYLCEQQRAAAIYIRGE